MPAESRKFNKLKAETAASLELGMREKCIYRQPAAPFPTASTIGILFQHWPLHSEGGWRGQSRTIYSMMLL